MALSLYRRLCRERSLIPFYQEILAMWFTSRFQRRKKGRSYARACRYVPQLEILEDRSLPSTLTVLNNFDSGAGSLRNAIGHAKDGDTIVFAASLDGQTIVLSSDELAIKNSVDIEGPGADKLTISGGDKYRVFDISEGLTVTIAGLTITHGRTSSGQGGGGILNTGNLTLASDVLSDNEVLNGVAQGGAIGNHNGAVLSAIDTQFAGNQAIASTSGGVGIATGGAILNGSFDNKIGAIATITGCTFTGNRAVGGDGGVVSGLFEIGAAYGGAIHNQTGASLSVANSTFIGNQAIAGNGGSGGKFAGLALVDVALGGGIGNADEAVLVVSGSTFSHNQALGGSNASGSAGGPSRVGNAAGGALGSTGVATVANSTFDHNEALGGNHDSAGSGLTLVGRGTGGGISSSLIFGSVASLIVSNSTFTNNQAVGGASNTGGISTGDGLGGGLANFGGSTAKVMSCTFNGNQAIGGAGSADANGGNGFGGGVYNDGLSTITMLTSTITRNQAIGGSAGSDGSAGQGMGGGAYFAPGGTACLDLFTSLNITGNTASTSDNDIFGVFTIC
jgi:hypothetical protein